MSDLADRVEHTVLGPRTSWSAVSSVLDDAIRLGMRACVPPWAVRRAAEYAPGVDLTTVIAFPHGQSATESKTAAARLAWEAGAAEVDVVANLSYLGDVDPLTADLAEVVAAVPIPVKVIVEAPLLNDAALREVAEAAVQAEAAYLKTATGFSGGGATVADVELLSQYLPVKASGGIETWEATEKLLAAGAERIGSSSGATIVAEYRADTT